MLLVLGIALFVLCLLPTGINAAINRSRFNAFKREDGSYVFVRRGGYASAIPDLDSLHTLGFDEKNVSTIPDEVVSIMKMGEPIPSLKPANQWADEAMRVKMDTILAFDPASYWTDSHFLVGHGKFPRSYNPSMVRIRKDKILYCWRSTDWDSQIVFGWYHHHNHTIVPDPRIRVNHSSIMLEGFQSPMQDDGRVMMLDRNTVVVTFSGVFDKLICQMYAIGTYSDATGTVEFRREQAYMLKYPENQKNWTPMLHNDKLLFFQNMNPVHVVAAGEDIPAKFNHTSNQKSVVTISELPKQENLPWDPKLYGSHIRGGTPIIHIKGVLMALFHTQASFIPGLFTYFFGAITFCPQPPFQIHSMSPVPIVKKSLYDGPWDTKQINYVLYPMGMVVDEKEEIVHVSMGYQDKNGYMIKMKIDELFESLQEVNPCPTSAPTGKQ